MLFLAITTVYARDVGGSTNLSLQGHDGEAVSSGSKLLRTRSSSGFVGAAKDETSYTAVSAASPVLADKLRGRLQTMSAKVNSAVALMQEEGSVHLPDGQMEELVRVRDDRSGGNWNLVYEANSLAFSFLSGVDL